MKKILIVLMLVAVLTAGAVVLAACGNDPPSGDNYFPDGNGGNGGATTDTVVTASNSSLIGYSAATSVSALAVLGGSGAGSSAERLSAETVYADEFGAEFEKQLAVIGSFIDRTGITVTEGASTEDGYAHFLSVTATGLDGAESTFVLHYNVSAIAGDDRRFDDDRDDWDIDNEEKFRLDGVMTYGGVTYTVVGEVENETEGNETEHEIELVAKNGVSCIVLEYGKETEGREQEEEFEYAYYANATYDVKGEPVGEPDEEFSIEFETENGKDELEVEFVSRTGDGNWTGIAVEYEAETAPTGTRIEIELTDTTGTQRVSAAAVVTVGSDTRAYTFLNPANWNTLGAKIFASATDGSDITA